MADQNELWPPMVHFFCQIEEPSPGKDYPYDAPAVRTEWAPAGLLRGTH